MMEGFIINIVGTIGFSGIFLVVFFSIYYLYLKGNEGKVREDDKVKGKRLEKRIMK
jgi:hypothetical protein